MPRHRVVNHDLRLRGKVWCLRKRVPKDVRDQVGREFIEESLHTSDRHEARRRRDARLGELNREWALIRRVGDPNAIESALADAELERRSAARGEMGEHVPTVVDRHVERMNEAAYRWGRAQGHTDQHGVGMDPDELRELFTEESAEGRRLLSQLEALNGHQAVDLAGGHWLAKSKLRDATKREYRRFFKTAAVRLPLPHLVSRDEARVFAQWLAEEGGEDGSGFSRKSVNNHLTALSWLWSRLGHDPSMWRGISFEPAKTALEREIWTLEETVRLLDAAKAVKGPAGVKLHRVIRIALYTGGRAKEIALMRYDAENDWLVIERETTKTEAGVRSLPCPDALREDVKAWVAEPWGTQSVSNRFSEFKKGLGFHGKQKVLHSFRHTLLSRLHELGVQEATAAKIAGHKHQGMTYGLYGGKTGVESLRDTMNSLAWDDRLKEERDRIASR